MPEGGWEATIRGREGESNDEETGEEDERRREKEGEKWKRIGAKRFE